MRNHLYCTWYNLFEFNMTYYAMCVCVVSAKWIKDSKHSNPISDILIYIYKRIQWLTSLHPSTASQNLNFGFFIRKRNALNRPIIGARLNPPSTFWGHVKVRTFDGPEVIHLLGVIFVDPLVRFSLSPLQKLDDADLSRQFLLNKQHLDSCITFIFAHRNSSPMLLWRFLENSVHKPHGSELCQINVIIHVWI